MGTASSARQKSLNYLTKCCNAELLVLPPDFDLIIPQQACKRASYSSTPLEAPSADLTAALHYPNLVVT
jgi:hypothetical protein